MALGYRSVVKSHDWVLDSVVGLLDYLVWEGRNE